MTGFDYFIIALFFVLIVYFGYVFKQVTGTTRKFFLADRSLPGWLAGITFISGNVSAMEILGLAGGGFVYGMVFAQYAWIGAIPAIVFLALVLVPYYYRNRIFNLLEFTGKRYGSSTRLFHSLLMLGYMVLALGTGLYAFSLALDVMFGLPLWISIIASALVLGIVTAAGGLSATVLVQFMAFSFIWFALLPLPFLSLNELGGWTGLERALAPEMLTVWRPADDPFMSWPATLIGLGFALAFASWSTDQAIMQNILAARSPRDAQMAPLFGGVIKLAVPLITVVPGMAAAVLLPDLETPDTAVFQLILRYYPTGLAGVAFLSVLAGFTAMNTGITMGIANIFTRNIYRHYIKEGASEEHYVRASRAATVGAVILGVLAAFVAAQFRVFYIWMQEYNIIVIVPVSGVLLLGLFWARTTTVGAFGGLAAGSLGALIGFIVIGAGDYMLWRAAIVLAITGVVTVGVSFFSPPRPREDLEGLLWGTLGEREQPIKAAWWKRPETLGVALLAVMTALVVLYS